MAELQNKCNSKIMTMIRKKHKPVILWESYKGQAIKACESQAIQFNLSIDDLLSEAYLIFSEAINSFDPFKAQFSTYFYWRLKKGLKSYIKTQQFDHSELFENDYIHEVTPEHNATFNNLLDNISSEAKEVVKLCLDMPRELIWFGKKNCWDGKRYAVSKNTVYQYLRDKYWRHAKIERAFAEIANIF